MLFGAIEAPFAQPRAIFFGHTISSIIGVAITKLFLHLPEDSFNSNLWLAGALCCATASTVMAITKTIHPPSGGTALIAATQADIRAMGWYYVPVVMLSSALMIAVGLITNNIQRQYPMYWWTSLPLSPKRQEKEEELKESVRRLSLALTDSGMINVDEEKGREVVVLSVDGVVVPDFLQLSYDQRAVLDELQVKLREYYNVEENV